MLCPNCLADYKDFDEKDFTNVLKTYNSSGLSTILRVRACPGCGYFSLTEEKHTGQEGFPARSDKKILSLKEILKYNSDLWLKKFPNETQLINKIKKAVE